MSPSPSPPQDPSPSPSPPPSPSDPSPTPRPRRAAASADSSTGSAGASSDGAGFFADPGPAFDAERAPEAPPVDEPDLLAELAEGWREETVRELLVMQGQVTHWALRVEAAGDTETWRHTEDDLRSIAPPLTRLLNRYDVTRAAAAAGDEISLAGALTGYGAKNYVKRRRLIAAVRAQAEVPASGVAPDAPEPEPEPDPASMMGPPPSLTPKGPHGRR